MSDKKSKADMILQAVAKASKKVDDSAQGMLDRQQPQADACPQCGQPIPDKVDAGQ